MGCCNEKPHKKERLNCPECGQSAYSVSFQTLLHQVQFPNNQTLTDENYAYCPHRNCKTGYFTPSSIIPKSEIRSFQPDQTAMLCYCFDISLASYQQAISDGTHQPIKDFVTQQTQLKRCACEIRNPSGRCCLADFKKLDKAHDHSKNKY